MMTEKIEHKNSLLEESYIEAKHASGLSMRIFPKDRQSCCAILASEYGSIDNEFRDDDGKMIKVPDGIAHFLEHKMFENENGISVEESFSKLGADSNAFTKWDATAYFFTCADSEKFYHALDELINFVMTPCFTEESVEREKGIIEQEILMCEDDPYDRCFLELVGGLYSHNPVRIDVAGTVKSIAKIDVGLLNACHKKFYTPSNMVLIVCGNVIPDKVIDAVDRYFTPEKYPASQKPKRKAPRHEKKVNSQLVSSKMPVERPLFSIGFKDSNAPKESRARLKRQMLTEILNELIFSSSGELYSSLYKNNIMTTPFSFGIEYGKTFAFAYAGGECDDPDAVLSEIKKHITEMKRTGVSAEDFERRKKMTYSSNIKLFDSTWDIASALLDDYLVGVELFEEFEIIKEMTVSDADSLLRELYCEENITFSTVLPKQSKQK